MTRSRNNIVITSIGILFLLGGFLGVILTGSSGISPRQVFGAIFGTGDVSSFVSTIVLQTRLPMALGAVASGIALSIAGLMMQTLFHNPLAGPSVLGISSGGSFGVALVMMTALNSAGILSSDFLPFISILAAIAGSLATIALLYLFSTFLKSGVSLIIVGLMLGYLFSSGISLLNYFAKADEIRSFVMWGLGSFSGLRLNTSLILLVTVLLASLPALWYIKPLNALLINERYAESVGYSVRKLRGSILLMSGLMVALPTAFCGPIGFIGLVVPHICRLLYNTSNHSVLLPASILFGAAVTLLCTFVSVIPSGSFGIIPINVITPCLGVPMILYLLLKRNKLLYF